MNPYRFVFLSFKPAYVIFAALDGLDIEVAGEIVAIKDIAFDRERIVMLEMSIITNLHGSERIPASIVVAGSMNERDIFVLAVSGLYL